MRAYKIYETIEFKQGVNPYRILKIGVTQQIAQLFADLQYIEYELDNNLNLIIIGNINTILYFKLLIEVSKLVKSIKIEGEIDLRYFVVNSPIIIPNNIIEISEGLRFFNSKKDLILPEKLYVSGGRVDLGNSGIKKLPKGLKVEGDLYISNTSISELPENLYVGSRLYWNNTPLAAKFPGKTKYMLEKYKNIFWNKGIKLMAGIIPT